MLGSEAMLFFGSVPSNIPLADRAASASEAERHKHGSFRNPAHTRTCGLSARRSWDTFYDCA